MAVQIPLKWTLAQMVPDSSTGPTAGTALRQVADDLAALQLTACASPEATDLASALVLVEELRDIVDAQAGATIGTTKAS